MSSLVTPNSIQRKSVFYQILICNQKKEKSKQIPVFCLALTETFPPGGLGGFITREPELLQGPRQRSRKWAQREGGFSASCHLLFDPSTEDIHVLPVCFQWENIGSPSPPLPHCVLDLFPPFHLPFSPPVLGLCWNLPVHLPLSHLPSCSYTPPSTQVLLRRPN